MTLSDIVGLGKIFPIDKLVDVVSKSVGRISKSYFDRKDIDSRAYEIEKLAEARAKEMKIISLAVKENFQLTGGIDYNDTNLVISSPKLTPIEVSQTILTPSIEERTQERLNFQEEKKQLNIENVTAFAAEELKNEPPITDEPLDEDWTTRFFRIVEDISNEEMQILWGKILAGEIKQPQTYSLRTLETIRNLSKAEADAFMKIAKFAIKSGNDNFIFKGSDGKLLSEKHNISYSDIALLIEIGLIQAGDFLKYQLLQQSTDTQILFTSGNIIMVAKIKANTPTISMPAHTFTNSGNELLKLVQPNPPFDYLTDIAQSIKRENFVEVKYGHILSREGDKIKHTCPLQDFAYK